MDLDNNNLCPRCGRDFEFPGRFPIRADDCEFECVPRLLDCMHTCCHSCLEESSIHGNSGQYKEVTCPICSAKKKVSGIFFIPLNGAVLKSILPSNGEVPLTCSRCHDDVESFSWCENCSAALCVFHHQDHKLSVNTAKHHVETITELQHKNIPIIHRLPPVPCPHDPSRDSSVFCHECGYLVSAESMMLLHKDHDYSDANTLIKPAKIMLERSRQCCDNLSQEIDVISKNIHQVISKLNSDTNECASEIENTFAVLRRALAAREKAMLSRLKSVSDRKKNALKEQLNNLQDLYDDCSQVFDTATSIINAGTVSEDEHAGIYMVATAHAVQRRTEELTKIFDNSDNVPIADPSIKCIFDDAECKQIEEVIQTLGWLGTTDYPPALTEAESKNRQNENIENEFINGKEPDSHSYKAENIVSFNADENIVDIPVLISLNIQSGPPPKLSVHNRACNPSEAISIEVSLELGCKSLQDQSSIGKSKSTHSRLSLSVDKSNNTIKLFDRYKRDIVKSKESLNGSVVAGEVLFITEVDKRLFKTEVRSFYESLNEEKSPPVLRITREVVKIA